MRLKNYHKFYCRDFIFCRFFQLIICFIISFHWSTAILNASGGYDNGTATGKGKLGLNLTWNPFNYYPEGQSYIIISYGFTEKFDFHSYYSNAANKPDNYYFGMFYQFINNKFIDLSTAIGIRQYKPKSDIHLFTPQLLYTINIYKGLRIGGSFVTIRDITKTRKVLGTTIDVALVIPLFKSDSINGRVNSIDFCIGAFRPVLWKPEKWDWYPTYSLDIKYRIFN